MNWVLNCGCGAPDASEVEADLEVRVRRDERTMLVWICASWDPRDARVNVRPAGADVSDIDKIVCGQ